MVEVELGGDGFGIGEVAGGEGGRDGGDGQSAATQRALGGHRQEGAVHAAGAGDDDGLHVAEDGFEAGEAGGLCHNVCRRGGLTSIYRIV